MGYLPYLAELPNVSDFFYIPNPAFGLRFIQKLLDCPIDVLEYPTQKEYERALEIGYAVVGISFMTFRTEEAFNIPRKVREYCVR